MAFVFLFYWFVTSIASMRHIYCEKNGKVVIWDACEGIGTGWFMVPAIILARLMEPRSK